jgi:hypothetical protein
MNLRRRLSQEFGKSPLGTYLIIFGLTVLLYLGMQFVPPYLQYYRLQQAFDKVSKDSSHMAEYELRGEINRALEYLDPPFELSDVAITRVGDMLIIDVYYKITVHLIGLEPIALHFNPHVERHVPTSGPPSQP